MCVRNYVTDIEYLFLSKNMYGCTAAMDNSCSCVILDHTTLLAMTCPTLPLIGYILPVK